MTKTQQYWAQRQEQKIEDLEHDWSELGHMYNGEQEEKFTVLVPIYQKPPKLRLLKLFFKGGYNGRREAELRSEVSIGQLEQSLGHELDKQKAVFKKCKSEDFCTANCLNYSKEANDFYRDTPRRIIVQFWMWYVSGNHKRDLSKKEEGEKYAENFLNDLVKEIAGVE